NSLVFNPNSPTYSWTLGYGTGAEQRIQTRGVTFTTSPNTNRIDTLSIKYASSNTPAYKSIETYQLYNWGWDLAQTRLDPDNSNLTNTFAYYDQSSDPITYGKLKSITYPDGYWELRLYDSGSVPGALQYLLHPFKSSVSTPDGATLSNSEVTYYAYNLTYSTLDFVSHYYGGTDLTNLFQRDIVHSYPLSSFIESEDSRKALDGGPGTYALGNHTIVADEGQPNGLAGHPLW